MIDMEKVTYGLRCMCYGDIECKECPYARNGSGWHDCRSNCAKDALELIKEQEAKPVEVCGQMFTIKYGHCPKCGKGMDSDTYPHWCGFCGQAVKWK